MWLNNACISVWKLQNSKHFSLVQKSSRYLDCNKSYARLHPGTLGGWAGRWCWVMVLGSFQCRGVLLFLHIVGQGPAVLAAGAGRVGYIFSLPEPKAHWWAYSISRHPSSVCQHFQTSSPQKPLGHLKPNFMWRLYGSGERKFLQTVMVIWPRWPPCPYMVKTLKNLLLRNQKANDLETWHAASGTQVLPNSCKWWSWVDLDLFYGKVKFGPLCFCMGKR